MNNLLSIFSVFALLLFMCPQDALAQRGGSTDSGFNQGIKVGPFGFILGFYNATYERKLKDKSSFTVGARFSNFDLEVDEFTSFGFNASYRIYFKEAITGPYFAPGISFGSNSSETTDSFSNIRPGAVVGWQWIFGGGFMMDLNIGAGYRLGFGDNVNADFDGVRPNFQYSIGYAF
jgi:hypothetical protein